MGAGQGLVSGFVNQDAAGNLSFTESDSNSMGSEDYIPDTENSIDDHIKPIQGEERKARKSQRQQRSGGKNIPN